MTVVIAEYDFNLFDLDLAACFGTSERLFKGDFAEWMPMTLAMQAAAVAGDREWLASATAMGRQLPPGPQVDPVLRWGEAMAAILVGVLLLTGLAVIAVTIVLTVAVVWGFYHLWHSER